MQERLFVLCLCAVATLSGCKQKSTLTTYPITGKITLRGKPLEGATVTLSNTNLDGPSAGATTDSQGNFRVSTYVNPKEAHAGAAPGDYVVVITKLSTAVKEDSSSMANMQNATPEERQRIMQSQWEKSMDQTKQGDKPKSEIPEKYTNAKSSPIKLTVVVGDNPPYDWDLTD
jgi:hypothetical protein